MGDDAAGLAMPKRQGSVTLHVAYADSGDLNFPRRPVSPQRACAAADGAVALARVDRVAVDRYDNPSAVTAAFVSHGYIPRIHGSWSGNCFHSLPPYGIAARAANAGSSLAARLEQSREAAELAQTAAVSALLALLPPQKLVSGTAHAVPATRDPAGLMRVPAAINGSPLDMIVDTGANLSVLSTSAAQKLGLRIVDGNASVGSSTRAAVGVRIGLADRFELGGLVFKDVAFLILDDRDLSPSPSLAYKIDGIIGFPIFSATSGFSFMSDGMFIPAPPSNSGVRAPLRAIGSDLFVEAEAGGRCASLHLDSGASTTALSWLFAGRNPDLIAKASRRTVRAAGAGGETHAVAAQLPSLDLSLNGETFHLERVDVQLEHDTTSGPFGTLCSATPHRVRSNTRSRGCTPVGRSRFGSP